MFHYLKYKDTYYASNRDELIRILGYDVTGSPATAMDAIEVLAEICPQGIIEVWPDHWAVATQYEMVTSGSWGDQAKSNLTANEGKGR